MKLAVLSGKGGTGKTFVSVNLAAAATNAIYIDCDVEEPNGRMFFKPVDCVLDHISVPIPVVDPKKCNGCRICVDFCKFNALAYVGKTVRVFDAVCHSCGGCMLLCPQKAITELEKHIGTVEAGKSENVSIKTGILNTGEESGVPIIKKLLGNLPSDDGLIVIDCPPGSSCTVMESIKNADYCILVAEPSIFGAHNLNLVYELVKLFGKPFGVVLNKCLDGENPSETFCIQHQIPILASIPYTSELATLNSNAIVAVREKQVYRKLFTELLQKCINEVQR